MDNEMVAQMNAQTGWVKEMGLVFTLVTADEVRCEWDVAEKHHQGYGIVHGGVHCGVVETVASVGAAVVALARKQRVVGLENTTSFIRAVKSGRLHAIGKPVTRGRTTQVWQVDIFDEAAKLVAKGQVRLLCLEEERALG